MDRRNFLRFLGLGAAAAVAAPIIKPKAFFSFYTGKVWSPPDPYYLTATEIIARKRAVYAHMANELKKYRDANEAAWLNICEDLKLYHPSLIT